MNLLLTVCVILEASASARKACINSSFLQGIERSNSLELKGLLFSCSSIIGYKLTKVGVAAILSAIQKEQTPQSSVVSSPK